MSQPHITIEQIETKKFKIQNGGYDQEEVDNFLDDICDEIESQLNTISKLQQQLREAQTQRPAQPAIPAQPTQAAATHVATDEILEVLELAQRVKSEAIAEAQKKAEVILEEARENAEAQLGDLAEERDRLTAEVEALKQQADSYRTKMLEMLDEQRQAISKFSL